MRWFNHLAMEAHLPASPIHILLVDDDEIDDDEIDVEAAVRAFAQKKIANPLTVAGDGFEALDVLRGEMDVSGFLALISSYLTSTCRA